MTDTAIAQPSHQLAFQGTPKGKNGKGQRKTASLPAETVEYLKAWMMSPDHIAHPYPTEQEKALIMADTGVELKQLTNWFVNNRKRYWKPRVEARLHQQAHAAAAAAQSHAVAAVTPAAQTRSPVTPESSFKPNLTTMLPTNGFVNFDLSTPQTSLVGTEFGQFFAARTRDPAVHAISVTSSSASVSGSDGDMSDSSSSSEEDHAQDAPVETSASKGQATESESQEQTAGHASSQVSKPMLPPAPSKRPVQAAQECAQSPRKKFRRVSLELWRDVCQNAPTVYCDSLPTLEEATQLFGFNTNVAFDSV
jgi:hypothetical protein